MMVCGDDPQSRPKPDPHNAMWICDTLGVRPADTIMVGDTPADTLMGQQVWPLTQFFFYFLFVKYH